MNPDHALIAAYKATTFRLYWNGDDSCFDLRIDDSNSDLLSWCAQHHINTWAIITAENPYSKVSSKEENEAQNSALLDIVQSRGFMHRKALGIPSDSAWEAEHSLFVANISEVAAVDLGKHFYQNAIVFGKADVPPQLIWCI